MEKAIYLSLSVTFLLIFVKAATGRFFSMSTWYAILGGLISFPITLIAGLINPDFVWVGPALGLATSWVLVYRSCQNKTINRIKKSAKKAGRFMFTLLGFAGIIATVFLLLHFFGIA